MKKMRCLIVDDEPLARKLIGLYLADQQFVEVVGACKDGQEAREILLGNDMDLVFLDINMPKVSGIELVEGLTHPPLVIITTAYESYAVKAFELDVVDYLVKPFSPERFGQACQKAWDIFHSTYNATQSKGGFIFLKTAYEWKKFMLDELLFVEGMKEYVKMETQNDGASLVYMRMKEMEVKLGEDFMRVHKSFIVNLDKVEGIAANELQLAGRKIPIGKSYKNVVKAHFSL